MNEISELVAKEEKRQVENLMLIPSENYASKKVRALVGSVLMNKYSEGYAGKRYYQGNKIIDEIENLAIEKAKELFNVPHANVQPYSGSPANSEVLFALINPKDTIMGMSLSAGGHLTHGHPNITFSGRYFRSVQFGLNEDGLIEYEEIASLAQKEKPKLMLIGTTAYPMIFNWEKFAEIAGSVGAYLVADISHIAGLVVAGVYPSPVNYAHVITTTTHKTLRGPRGAIIMVTQKGLDKDPEIISKIDRAVFPGMQGGPHDNTTAAIAQCLTDDSLLEFKIYGKQIVANAKVLAEELKSKGLKLVANGTESHLMVIDLREIGLSGNIVAEALEVAGIVANRNSVPNDNMPPFYPSGVRLGTPAVTTRGMKETEMKMIAVWISEVIEHVKNEKLPLVPEKRLEFMKEYRNKISNDKFLLDINQKVKKLTSKFPVP